MKRHVYAILALVACAATSCGAPPGLSVPKEVRGKPCEFVHISAETSGKSVRWVSLDEGLRIFPSSLLIDGKSTVVVGCRPGRYRLLAITASADELSEFATCTVVIDEGTVIADVGRRGVWLVVIEETSQRTAQHASVMSDPELVKYIRGKGWEVRIADQDARDASGRTPRDLAPYIARAKGKKLPYMIIVDAEGNPRHEGPVPASTAELLSALRKVGG